MTLSVRILRVLAMSREEARAPRHSQVYVCFVVGAALSSWMDRLGFSHHGWEKVLSRAQVD